MTDPKGLYNILRGAFKRYFLKNCIPELQRYPLSDPDLKFWLLLQNKFWIYASEIMFEVEQDVAMDKIRQVKKT
mgnify:CR=1 FL=1